MAKSNLELQLESTTPENITSNKTLNTLLELYLDSFDELQPVLESPLNVLDTDFLIKRFEETKNENFNDIRKEIFKIHLEEIYRTFEEIDDSEEIFNKFKLVYESLGLPTDQLKIVASIDESINSEYLNASNSFKTKKGTRSGFFFVYDIINRAGIQSINSDGFFNLIEGTDEDPNTPFEYTVKTSLYKEVFSRTVVPLAHPVGFNWNFVRLLYTILTDYFGLEETVTLRDTTLTCYGVGEGSISQIEIIESKIYGEFKSFLVSRDQDNNEELIIDYYPLDGTVGNGLRIVREYNGRIILYDRQDTRVLNIPSSPYDGQIKYLEIEEVRLSDIANGILTQNFVNRDVEGETFIAVESIDFKEYTIIDKATVTIEFRIRGDKEGVWNSSRLVLENKVVSSDTKFFEPINFTRQELFEACNSYNGRIVEDRGTNCQIHYKAIHTFKATTTDVSEYVESKRPLSVDLPRNTDDISINQADWDEAIANGEDPYDGLYGTLDHTIEETNIYDGIEFWGRLSKGATPIPITFGATGFDPETNVPHIAPQIVVDPETQEITYIPDGEITDLVIGGPWTIDKSLHIFDIGFNPNSEPPRWEQYYRPNSEEDLAILNSTTTPARYERDNLEYEGDTALNNQYYHAWEDYTMDISIQVFKEEEYIYDTFVDAKFINTEENGGFIIGNYEYIGGSPYIISPERDIEYYINTLENDGFVIGDEVYLGFNPMQFSVDADVYRAQWNYREDNLEYTAHEVFYITDMPTFEDIVDSFEEETSIISETKTIDDPYANEGLTELFISDTEGEYFLIGGQDIDGTDFRIGNTYSLIEGDDWSFGVYRWVGSEWVLLEDNNIAMAA